MGYRRYYNEQSSTMSQSISALTSSLYTTVSSGSSVISFSNEMHVLRVNLTELDNDFLLLPPNATTTNSYIQGVAFTAQAAITASFDIKYAAGTASLLNSPFTGVLAAGTVYTASLASNLGYRFVKNGTRMHITSSVSTGTIQVDIFYKNQIP